jgi:uncharacterized protein YjeT (DUF2065 family)
MLSNYLAELWGILMVIVSLALLVKDGHVKRLFSKIESEESLFMWGMVSVIIGVSMVLSHNVWVKNWQVVVTILGWASLLKGLMLLFAPDYVKKLAKQIENKQWLSYVLVAMVFVGLILTYLGFKA